MNKRKLKSESEVAELIGVPPWKLQYVRSIGRINPVKVGPVYGYDDIDIEMARAIFQAKQARKDSHITKKGNQAE